MALIKLGPMVGQASGSIGATTFSHGRSGTYTRRRAIPVNPQSPRQVSIRAGFTAANQAWRDTLTAAEREGWNDYAAQTPVVNRLGDRVPLSGNAMYCAYNAQLLSLPGGVRVDTPPSTPGEAAAITVTQTAGEVAGWIITAASAAIPDGDVLMVYTGASPVSPAVNFFGSPYTYNGLFATSTLPFTVTIPGGIFEGQRWFVEFRLFTADGRRGPRTRQFVDVAA